MGKNTVSEESFNQAKAILIKLRDARNQRQNPGSQLEPITPKETKRNAAYKSQAEIYGELKTIIRNMASSGRIRSDTYQRLMRADTICDLDPSYCTEDHYRKAITAIRDAAEDSGIALPTISPMKKAIGITPLPR